MRKLLHIIQDNRLVEGGVVIGDRTIGFADITCPILIFVGETDFIAPPETVRIIGRAAPNAEIYECSLPVSHFGLPVSSHAKRTTWPGVAAWVRWTAGKRKLPDSIHELSVGDLVTDDVAAPAARGHVAGLMYGTALLAEAGLKLPAALRQTGRDVASTVAGLSREAAVLLPELVRLESMTPRSRVSYALLLDDLARSQPDQVAFLFADRAHTQQQAKHRIDSVVRGLISGGVRRGERVGVLMNTRPSALVAIAALNRIGAVAVLHRGPHDVEQEIRLGRVTKIVADPEHVGIAAAVLPTLVLGAAYEERGIPYGAIDLERIDPDSVRLPDWYRPNAGRAEDVAFVLFRGTGDQVRADLITNGRWATSALAATAACSLTRGDTLYSTSPLHHPAGLLLASAAATASGCRLALAGGFDPQTFWSEVRRYRATVVT